MIITTNNAFEQNDAELKRQYFIIINERNDFNFSKKDNGWIDGVDRCAACPNRPGGPLNKSGFCNCAIPSLYGPNRIIS